MYEPIIALKATYSKDHVEIPHGPHTRMYFERSQLCYRVFALNKAHKNQNHRNHYKEMNEPSERIGSHETEHPENQEDDGNGVKHGCI